MGAYGSGCGCDARWESGVFELDEFEEVLRRLCRAPRDPIKHTKTNSTKSHQLSCTLGLKPAREKGKCGDEPFGVIHETFAVQDGYDGCGG